MNDIDKIVGLLQDLINITNDTLNRIEAIEDTLEELLEISND